MDKAALPMVQKEIFPFDLTRFLWWNQNWKFKNFQYIRFLKFLFLSHIQLQTLTSCMDACVSYYSTNGGGPLTCKDHLQNQSKSQFWNPKKKKKKKNRLGCSRWCSVFLHKLNIFWKIWACSWSILRSKWGTHLIL